MNCLIKNVTLRIILCLLFSLTCSSAYAAITFVSSVTTQGNDDKASITVPVTVQTDDLLLVQVTIRDRSGSDGVTTPSGWTLVAAQDRDDEILQSLYYRVASASDGGTAYEWDFDQNGNRRYILGMSVFRGVDTNMPINAQRSQTGFFSGVTAPSVTTTSTDTMLVAYFTLEAGNHSFVTPAGMTESYDTEEFNNANGLTSMSAYVLNPVAGGSNYKFGITSPFEFFEDGIGHLLALTESTAPTIPISCSTSLPSVAFLDDFSSVNAGWQTVDFTRTISNWPGDSIYNSASENQTVIWSISGGRLGINGAVSSGGDNEYGMVKFELTNASISKTTVNDYAISVDLSANKVNTNNDIGIVFGFVDDSNYYLAKWGKYGTSYASSTTFPGTYRRLELVKVSGGVASSLAYQDSFDVSDPFNMEVVVNSDGTAVCVNDTALLYSASEQPILNDVGLFSYDNDVGVFADNFELRCDNCQSLAPIANFQFDECTYTGSAVEVIDQTGSYSATSFGGVVTTTSGQVERALNIATYSQYIETAIPLTSSFSVSTWFKKPTDTSGSPYFALGAMASGGDLLYLDRTNSWRWGVYRLGGGSINGTYSFSALDSNWHHLSLVYSSTQTQLYIDGSLVDTVSLAPTGTLKYVGTSFDGVNTTNAQGFRAPLDEFMVFNSALSSTQVASIYTNQSALNNWDGTSRAAASCNSLLALYQFEQTAFATNVEDTSGNGNHGSNIGGLSTASGQYCRGFDSNGTNTGSETNHAFSAGIDLDGDVGIQGSISFWFNSNTDWNLGGYSGGERTLFDASEDGSGVDKYFQLEIQSNGRLRFAFEDSSDADFYIEEPASTVRVANTWYYLTVTWDYATDTFEIYVNSTLVTQQTKNTNGMISGLGPIIFGDNASTYSANANGALASRTSANGKFDEVRIYKEVRTQAQIQTAMLDNSCTPLIDHYQIIHDGTALTCEAETVTIKACTNAYDGTCTESADSVSLDLKAAGTTDTIDSITFTGNGSATLNHMVAETTVLSIENATVTANSGFVCNDNSAGSCNLVFADAGFRFLYGAAESTTINAQIAGVNFTEVLKLQAVENVNGICTGLFTGDNDVSLSQLNANPSGTGGLNFRINGSSAIAKAPSYTDNISLNFGADSKATILSPNYLDAGQIRLQAQYDMGGVSLIGNSNYFWVQPNKLVISATGSALLTGSSPTSTITHKAGESFTLVVTAVNAAGDITLNYQVGQIQLLLDRTGPSSGGVDGSFKYATTGSLNSDLSPSYTDVTLENFSAGVSTFSSATYSEVGLLNLDLQDSNYAGAQVLADAINIGRFIPDHFSVNKNDGAFSPACNVFSYIGQPFTYSTVPSLTIVAENALDITTANYTHTDYQKLTVQNSNITRDFPVEDAELGKFGLNELTISSTNSLGSFGAVTAAGELLYSFNSSDTFTYDKNPNSEVGNFNNNLTVSITKIEDSDGVAEPNLSVATPLVISPSAIDIRYGRWVMQNAFGPETENLSVSAHAEFLHTSGEYVLNDLDSNCTVLLANPVGASSTVTVGSGTSEFSYNSPLIGGEGGFLFTAPGSGNTGSIDMNVDLTLLPWLQYDWNGNGSLQNHPKATVTFGQYRGHDRIIYWREVQ